MTSITMAEVVNLAFGSSVMDCYVARPTSTACGGILACMYRPEVNEFVRDVCKHLASEGDV